SVGVAVPHVVSVAADEDVTGDLAAVRVFGPLATQPDHQLGAVGLAGGGAGLIEPDVVGRVIDVLAAAGLGGSPARGYRASADVPHPGRQAAARRAGAIVTALVDVRIAAGLADSPVLDRGVHHP